MIGYVAVYIFFLYSVVLYSRPCHVLRSFSRRSILCTNSKFFMSQDGAMTMSRGAWLMKRSMTICGESRSAKLIQNSMYSSADQRLKYSGVCEYISANADPLTICN